MSNSIVKFYVDGGCLGKNPSPDGIYYSVGLEHSDGTITLYENRTVDTKYSTNNEAEYLALLAAIRHALPLEGKVIIHSDSQLIVNQFNGRWAVTSGTSLETLLDSCRSAAAFLHLAGREVEVVWVGRKENVKRLGH